MFQFVHEGKFVPSLDNPRDLFFESVPTILDIPCCLLGRDGRTRRESKVVEERRNVFGFECGQ